MNFNAFSNTLITIFTIILLVIYYFCGFLTWVFETFSIFGFVVLVIVAMFPACALAIAIYFIIDSKSPSFFREESELFGP